MHLTRARKLATELLQGMAPWCERIEVAGSIRRQQEHVKDIEIVAVPRWISETEYVGLFQEKTVTMHNQLFEWANAMTRKKEIRWIKTGTNEILDWEINSEGKYWRGLLPDGQTKLDLFLTTPKNFGAQFLIRTGNADFSQAVVTHARTIGMPFTGGYVTRDGEDLNTPEERDVFDLLNLRYVEPWQRNGWNDLVRLHT